jgi:hypothetical protein
VAPRASAWAPRSSNFADPPCSAASFEVNSEPHTGARPSVRLCVGLISSSKLLVVPFDPDLHPKGAVLRLLIGTPASGSHRDPAAGQTPVFGRAAEEFDGRCVCLRPWLIHVDPRQCSYAADAWATRTRGTPHSGLRPSLNSVSETRGTSNYSQHQG